MQNHHKRTAYKVREALFSICTPNFFHGTIYVEKSQKNWKIGIYILKLALKKFQTKIQKCASLTLLTDLLWRFCTTYGPSSSKIDRGDAILRKYKKDLAILQNWQSRKTGNPVQIFFLPKILHFKNVVSKKNSRHLPLKLWKIEINGGGVTLRTKLIFYKQIWQWHLDLAHT